MFYPTPTPIEKSDLAYQPRVPENLTPLAQVIAKKEQEKQKKSMAPPPMPPIGGFSNKRSAPPPMPPPGMGRYNHELSKMDSPRSPDRTIVRSSPPRSPDKNSDMSKNRFTDSAKRTSQSTGSKRRWSAESVIESRKKVRQKFTQQNVCFFSLFSCPKHHR